MGKYHALGFSLIFCCLYALDARNLHAHSRLCRCQTEYANNIIWLEGNGVTWLGY